MAYDDELRLKTQVILDENVGKICECCGREITIYQLEKILGIKRGILYAWHKSYQATKRR